MTIPQALQQQDKAAQAILACVGGNWLRIVVNSECIDEDERDNTLSFYVKRKGRDLETVDLRLPRTALEELRKLRDVTASQNALKWSTCDLVIDNTGNYNFNFSYGPPKRINGIHDEESYERFRNYAEKHKRELDQLG